MEKLMTFWKKNYKVLIPVLVVFVLLLAVYFLYREYRYDNYRNRQEVKVYQYFGGIKTNYTAVVTYNLKDVIVSVEAKNKKIDYDSTPIYYKDSDKVIFPSEMNAVFPLQEGSQYKVYQYSTYEFKDGLHMIKNNTTEEDYNYFFLFDGKGLFFFPSDVTIKIDGNDYKKLTGMSYVKTIGGYTMEIYDKGTDTSEVIELEGKNVTVYNDSMNVSITERYVLSFGRKILLVSPYNLNSLN